MNGALLLAALLSAALGLPLSYAPRRDVLAALALLALGAVAAGALWQPRLLPGEAVRVACSIGIAATAAVVHIPGGVPRWAALGLGANAGFWLGALAVDTGSPLILLALPLTLLAFPGAWIAGGRYGFALKVASGWLIAIGMMTAALPLLSTPGYQKAHME